MIQSTQFTKAALMLNEAQERISEMLGIAVKLSFEIETSKSLNTSNVLRIVSQVSGISVYELSGKGKTNTVVYARYVCFYLMRKYLGMTLKAIGEILHRDHATVINGLDIVERETNNTELSELLLQSESTLIKELRNEN